MPSRIVREGILTSERINALSPNAELFYRRLMSVVDDFGRFSANLTLLRASCYPLKLDSVKEDSISKHLAECVGARLIVLYTVAGKAFLELQDFRQQVRAKESKYPSPDMQMRSRCAADDEQTNTDVHLDVVEDVSDTSTRSASGEQKDSLELPDWMPATVWQEFVRYRKQIRKPMTLHAQKLNLGKLDGMRAQGHDPVKVVNGAIANGWQGLYPERPDGQQRNATQQHGGSRAAGRML